MSARIEAEDRDFARRILGSLLGFWLQILAPPEVKATVEPRHR